MKPKTGFEFEVTTRVWLDLNEIWVDEDPPENPSVDDVLREIAKCGGADRVISDWDLQQGDTELLVDGRLVPNLPRKS